MNKLVWGVWRLLKRLSWMLQWQQFPSRRWWQRDAHRRKQYAGMLWHLQDTLLVLRGLKCAKKIPPHAITAQQQQHGPQLLPHLCFFTVFAENSDPIFYYFIHWLCLPVTAVLVSTETGSPLELTPSQLTGLLSLRTDFIKLWRWLKRNCRHSHQCAPNNSGPLF